MFRRTVFSLAFVLTAWSSAHAQQLVLLVRHAERADGGAGAAPMTGKPADPLLSAAGTARAERLASVLGDAGITAVYATEYRRTQDTAKPLASKLGLPVRTVAANNPAALVAELRKQHADGIVLVVGHSNTLPDVIKTFGGTPPAIGDDEYDNLFVFVPATRTLSRIRF